jgi:tRNA pseudouridine55 synthase
MQAQDFIDGQLLLIDKPLHWTSFQAVNKIKWLLKTNWGLQKIKVGHAGTLDPLATGLLLVCTGAFTKKISELQGQTKEYTGTFFLGATTPSFDLETAVDKQYETLHITKALVEATAQKFIGEISQKPPIFSAIKKDGQRLYELARAGKETEIEARKTTLYEFEITHFSMPEVNFRIKCSKGTYIRSIAHDFGAALQSGAYLASLRRTQIGDYKVSDALLPNDVLVLKPE